MMEGNTSSTVDKNMESIHSTNPIEASTDDVSAEAPAIVSKKRKAGKGQSRLGEQRSKIWQHFHVVPVKPVVCLKMETKLKEGMARFYEWYVKHDSLVIVEECNKQCEASIEKNVLEDEDDEDVHAMFTSQFKKHLARKENTSTSELDRYLLDGCVEDEANFDILSWWKTNSTRYRILSQVARDVLAIPVSTVASESAFSTGGRVLDPFRSTLAPKTVEALICAQDWLRSTTNPVNIKKAMEEVEEYEKLETVVGSMESMVIDDDE